MNWKYIVPVLLLTCLSAAGQSHTLWFGGGLTLEALRDEGYSPLLFSGTGLTGLIGYEKTASRRETTWLLSYGHINTANRYSRNLTVNSVGLLNVNLYKRVDSPFAWGWSNNNGFHNRNIDGFSNFNGRTDFFTSFGPAGKYERSFAIKNQLFTFKAISHLQLIGFYVPSGYVASLPKGFGYEPNGVLQGFWNSIYLFYPGGAWNAALWPKAEWHLSTGNSISLNYLYEYTRLSGAQMHERSSGMWFLTFNMKLK
jgi:hypothetical protein